MLKKLSALVLSVVLFSLLVSPVSAAFSSGPAGRNQTRAYPGPGKGQVTLEWQRFYLDIENYIVRYGNSSGKYNFGNFYIGNIVTYTIGGLNPGQRYFFAVEGVRTGNNLAGVDAEVSAVAPARPTVVRVPSGPLGRNSLTGKPGPKKGQVSLTWSKFFSDTQLFNIVYGLLPGQYSYGVIDAADANPATTQYEYTIGALQSGKRYYFALIPQRNGTGIYTTTEISVVAR